MAARHLIIGGGTAGMNAIRTIREEETERLRAEVTRVKESLRTLKELTDEVLGEAVTEKVAAS